MTDATRPDGGGGHDPWAPPENKPSLDKNQTPQPPSVHDQATVTSMPGVGFPPPTGAGAVPPPPVAPTGAGAVPPPPVAPMGPGASGGYGYPGYPQGGYGWPGMPPAPQNGMGVAAMVLGILSCALFCMYGVVSLVTGVLAVIFGIKGRRRAEAGVATNHGQAQAGLIMGIIGIILGIVVIVLIAIGITAAINSDKYDDDPSYNTQGAVATAAYHH